MPWRYRIAFLAGFQVAWTGTVFIDNQDVTNVPANKRDIGFVFQNYALFPHLTVRENVAYGLRVRRQSAADIASNVEKVLHLVDLGGFGPRLPNELSGGQQQRVALARAIVIQPRVLLFDEPLSNLDAKLQVQMRSEIRALQRVLNITTVYVTHDQEEAMAISDRIAVLDRGRVVQCDTAEELYRRPLSSFVASFLGRANLLDVVFVGHDGDRVVLKIVGQILSTWASTSLQPGNEVKAVVRPEAIGIGPAGGGLTATVTSATYLGDKVEYIVRVASQSLHIVRFNPPESERFAPGSAVSIDLPSAGMQLLPRD